MVIQLFQLRQVVRSQHRLGGDANDKAARPVRLAGIMIDPRDCSKSDDAQAHKLRAGETLS
jgi:hypothetical protein